MSLAENDRAAATFNGAFTTTTSALGGPPAGIPSSDGAQVSLEVSWGASSKAGWASKALFRESTFITTGLF